jgi:hypothetical protein
MEVFWTVLSRRKNVLHFLCVGIPNQALSRVSDEIVSRNVSRNAFNCFAKQEGVVSLVLLFCKPGKTRFAKQQNSNFISRNNEHYFSNSTLPAPFPVR